ncbi:MAG TPA: acyl-CoA dehydrogenase family protein [Candidatus Binataceae bacterium]|jgi:acyl-CoA dehydrogenase|nr:acyl-CoA dehydrogenase family protein [Candidatus Binataceae bacterium]
MIDFEIDSDLQQRLDTYRVVAQQIMRPISREYDENEHARPLQFYQTMWEGSRQSGLDIGPDKGASARKARTLFTIMAAEELSWGDVGLFLQIPNPGLGGAAVMAAGTPEQKQRFLKRFGEGKPKWAAMAITEPGCGSDSAAITTTARREGDHWVLNGTKIFCTSGKLAAESSEGFVVVWATVDKSAGRAGIKPFVVEHHTPGMTVVRVENKLGIRVSDTAALIFEDCKVPLDNVLGSPEVKPEGGFKDVMATFDATRPIVAAMAIGVGRAALDYVRDFLKQHNVEIRYGLSPQRLSAVERDFMEMEIQLKAARLLAWRAAWLLDNGQPNNLEASMAKAKAGLAVTQITQKAVELLGPLGYSRTHLLEKWMRDAKINDIFEGTQQINLLIIARRILGYGSKELQ